MGSSAESSINTIYVFSVYLHKEAFKCAELALAQLCVRDEMKKKVNEWVHMWDERMSKVELRYKDAS